MHRSKKAFPLPALQAQPQPLFPMNLNNVNRDELVSHTAELLSKQDDNILSLIQERRVLAILLAILLSFQLLF